MARNCLRNAERSHRRRDRLVHRLISVDPPRDAGHQTGNTADHDHLHQALSRLKDHDAEILRLWAWEQFSPADIAVVLSISANAVGVRLHRAKQRLRVQLDRLTP